MALKVSLNVKSFVERLNQRSLDLPIEEKQKIVRLIVKKILIGKKIEGKRDLTVVHCIPTKESCLGITNENLQLCAGRLGL